MQKLNLLFACILFLSASCRTGEKAASVNPDFIGTWSHYYTSEGDIIIIDSDSKGTTKHCVSCVTSYNGTSCSSCDEGGGRAKINGDYLYIGLTKYHIDQKPYKVTAYGWERVLDGKTYKN